MGQICLPPWDGFVPWNLYQSFQYHWKTTWVAKCRTTFISQSACCLAQTSPAIWELWVMTLAVKLYTCQTHLFTGRNDFSVLGHSEGQSWALWSFVGCWFMRRSKPNRTGENLGAVQEAQPVLEPSLTHWRVVWRRSQEFSQPPGSHNFSVLHRSTC